MVGAQYSLHFAIALALTGSGNDYVDYLEAEQTGFSSPRTVTLAEKVRVELDDA